MIQYLTKAGLQCILLLLYICINTRPYRNRKIPFKWPVITYKRYNIKIEEKEKSPIQYSLLETIVFVFSISITIISISWSTEPVNIAYWTGSDWLTSSLQ